MEKLYEEVSQAPNTRRCDILMTNHYFDTTTTTYTLDQTINTCIDTYSDTDTLEIPLYTFSSCR